MNSISDTYAALVEQSKIRFRELSKDSSPKLRYEDVYSEKDAVHLITALPNITQKYLTIHNLSHYKHKRLVMDITVPIKSNIEILTFKDVGDF